VLGQLAGFLEQAEGGRGSLVLLRGEAGIGKTSVVGAFAERVRGTAVVLCGGCDPLSTPQPLGPIADLVEQLDAEAAAALTEALAGGDGVGAVCALLRQVLATSDGASVLIVEDVHWADGATLDVLRYLARRAAGLPAVLVLTYRDDEIGPEHPLQVVLGDVASSAGVHRISLPALSRAAVGALAAGRVADVDALHRVTGGNPFFVTEVIDAGLATDTVPGSVREAVLGRMARLSPPGRATADAAAILGAGADVELIEALAPGCIDTGLRECLDIGVLRPDGLHVGFRHELARRAALDAVAPYQRRRLHTAALAALGAPPIAPEVLAALAFHAEQAADTEAVLHYGPQAAAHAAALGAHQQAAQQYERTLRHADTAPAGRRVMWLEGHAFESYLSGWAAASVGSLTDAIGLRHESGDRLREGDDLRFLSHVLFPIGDNQATRKAGLDAVEVLQGLGPTPELAWAYANLVMLACCDFDADQATAYADKALRLGEQLDEPAVVIRAQTFAAMARLLCRGQGWEDLEEVWRAAMARPEMAEQAGMAGGMICWAAAMHHDLQRADRYIAETEAYCREHDLDMFRWLARSAAALSLLNRGEWTRAVAEADDVLAWPGLSPLHRIMPLVTRALVRARRGEGGVWPLLDEALDCGEPTDLWRLGMVWAARAEAKWLTGDNAAAITEAEHGLKAATLNSDPWLVGALLRWIRMAGGQPLPLAAAKPYALELAGDWRAAAGLWTELGCPYDAALAQLSGGPDATRIALSTFQALGAHGAAQLAETRLRQLGHRRTPYGRRAATRANPHGLTPREADVLALLREALTDAEIAARLHITPKTVGHHVGAILTKLDVHSRREAAIKSHDHSGGG
jgi:DNA-binding CsgD family transcriptional regulator